MEMSGPVIWKFLDLLKSKLLWLHRIITAVAIVLSFSQSEVKGRMRFEERNSFN